LTDSLGTGNYIVSPGCDMPYDTPLENTIAVAQAVHEPEKIREMIKNYEAVKEDIEVELPDYGSLSKPLIEVCTLDAETCAACTYMVGAVNEIKKHFGDAVDVAEYKYTLKEDIARFIKMGVAQLPSIYINGGLAYSSIIPSKAEFIEKVTAAMEFIR
jgi:uroporphyrinogen decarboxylase